MTKTETIKVIKQLGLAASCKDGEYRITTGGEEAAYYTDDADDAIATAKRMVAAKPSDKVCYVCGSFTTLAAAIEAANIFNRMCDAPTDEWPDEEARETFMAWVDENLTSCRGPKSNFLDDGRVVLCDDCMKEAGDNALRRPSEEERTQAEVEQAEAKAYGRSHGNN